MPEKSADIVSPEQMLKSAPWICLGAFLVILATFMYNRLYVVGLVLAPPLGLLAFACLALYWRTGISALAGAPTGLFIIVGISLHGTLLWGLPQSLAIAILFMHIPFCIFGKAIVRWARSGHG